MIQNPKNLRSLAALFGGLAFILFNPSLAIAGAKVTPVTPEMAKFVNAKASAYSSGSACNGQWAHRTAIGTALRSGEITSAAADWSKFPLGTKFRVVETGRIYQVDDYGSAMVGKMKVDLYTPSGAQMNRWGVRNVTLEILEWGNRAKSLEILAPRGNQRYGYIRRMIASLRSQMEEPKRPS